MSDFVLSVDVVDSKKENFGSASFDYRSLPDEYATQARKAADIIRKHGQRISAHMLQVGRELRRTKVMLGHGNFGRWMRHEFECDERTLRRYMSAAERLEHVSDIVSVLNNTELYELSSASPRYIDEVAARLQRGERLQPGEIGLAAKESRQQRHADRSPKRRRRKTGRAMAAKQARTPAVRDRVGVLEQERAAADFATLLEGSVPELLPRLAELLETAGYLQLSTLLKSAQ